MGGEEGKAEWRRWRLSMNSSTEAMVDQVFPSTSAEEKAEFVRLLQAGGVGMGRDLKGKYVGLVHEEMGLPEWACQVLVDKDLLAPGPPKEVHADALQVLELQHLKACAGRRTAEHFKGVKLSREMLEGIRRLLSKSTRLELAASDMGEGEESAEFSRARVQAMFGCRAFFRLVAKLAPVQSELVDSRTCVGSYYFITKSTKSASGSSSSSSWDCEFGVDWSKVVWMAQAEGPGISYGEAVGRIVQGMRRVFIHQPCRKFAFGVVCGLNYFHIYKFNVGGYKIQQGGQLVHTRLVPEYSSKHIFCWNRVPGFFRLVQLFCTPDFVHGFGQMCSGGELGRGNLSE